MPRILGKIFGSTLLACYADVHSIPGIAQIYGMCKSVQLQALIFHGGKKSGSSIKKLELNQSDTELVPVDIYAWSIDSPMRNVNFEFVFDLYCLICAHLSQIHNFAVSTSDFLLLLYLMFVQVSCNCDRGDRCQVPRDSRRSCLDFDLNALVISHLPYNNTGTDVSITVVTFPHLLMPS